MGALEREVVIVNRLGLHARAAASFVQLANRFHAAITLVKDGMEVNGKSIMGIMMLAAGKGALLTLRAAGEDAPQALESLATLVADRFGERE